MKEEIQYILKSQKDAGTIIELCNSEYDFWEHCELPEEKGLEAWIYNLAAIDKNAGIAAAVASAQFVLPHVSKRADEFYIWFKPDQDNGSPETPVKQVELAQTWLNSLNEEDKQAAIKAVDLSRQLNIWDDDLKPFPDGDKWYIWFFDATNLALFSLLDDGPHFHYGGYCSWKSSVAAARSVICSLKSLRMPGESVADNTTAIIQAVQDQLRSKYGEA